MQRRKEFGRFMKNMKSCEADVVTWRVGQAQDEASILEPMFDLALDQSVSAYIPNDVTNLRRPEDACVSFTDAGDLDLDRSARIARNSFYV